ncbi:MAG: sulfite exporter TauE/SafE family protein, partial [bacterium]
AHVVHGITGFGAMVLALPLLSLLFPVKIILPVMVVVSFFQVGWFVITQWDRIQFKHAASILVLAAIGFPFGFAVFSYLPTKWLEIALGLFVIFVALWNLSGIETSRQLPQPAYYLLNFAGGIVQGALASGGPLLVIYAARMIKDKSEFRATLSLVWVVLGAFLAASYTIAGVWKPAMAPLILLGLPAVAAGTAAGIYLHDRIPQKPFRLLVFTLLLMAGAVLARPLFFS